MSNVRIINILLKTNLYRINQTVTVMMIVIVVMVVDGDGDDEDDNCNDVIIIIIIIINSMAYGTRRFNAAFTRALQ